jgi:hypothetical protein
VSGATGAEDVETSGVATSTGDAVGVAVDDVAGLTVGADAERVGDLVGGGAAADAADDPEEGASPLLHAVRTSTTASAAPTLACRTVPPRRCVRRPHAAPPIITVEAVHPGSRARRVGRVTRPPRPTTQHGRAPRVGGRQVLDLADLEHVELVGSEVMPHLV